MNQLPTKTPSSQNLPQPKTPQQVQAPPASPRTSLSAPQQRSAPQPQGQSAQTARPQGQGTQAAPKAQRPQGATAQRAKAQMRPPVKLPKRCRPSNAFFISLVAFVLTLALLAGTVVALGVAMVVELVSPRSPVSDDDGDEGGKKDPPKTEQTTPVGNQITAKYLTFPSQTSGGPHRSSSSSAVVIGDSNLKSAAAILVDMKTNTSIFESASDTPIHPASMTKVMTLLVACEAATDPTELLTITPEMITALQDSGGASTLGGWQAGDQVTVEDALFLVNYKSDTIACWLLANRFGGSEAGFVEKMNQRASALGLSQTNFVNCTGLEHENHKTTCREMAAMMHAAMNNPAAKKVLTSYEAYTVQIYRDGKSNRTAVMYASWYSERLGDNAWVGNGSDLKFRGGKTGWETTPSSCFVTVAQDTENSDNWYICVTVGRVDRSQSEVSSSSCTRDAKYLYRRYAEGNTSAVW